MAVGLANPHRAYIKAGICAGKCFLTSCMWYCSYDPCQGGSKYLPGRLVGFSL